MAENVENYEPLSFDAIRIGLASPDKIREWSHGIVPSLKLLTIVP